MMIGPSFISVGGVTAPLCIGRQGEAYKESGQAARSNPEQVWRHVPTLLCS
jgi:hypothetical protein